jgi:hypothetical protein
LEANWNNESQINNLNLKYLMRNDFATIFLAHFFPFVQSFDTLIENAKKIDRNKLGRL